MNNEMNNNPKTSEIIISSLKISLKKHRRFYIASVALLIVAAIIGSGVGILKSDSAMPFLLNKLIDNSSTSIVTGITFYTERNKDYSREEDGSNYLAMFDVYYYANNDTSGEKIYLPDSGDFTYADGEDHVKVGFLFTAAEKVAKIRTAMSVIAVVVAVAAVGLSIFAWYKSFEKRELAERAKNKAKKIRKKKNN